MKKRFVGMLLCTIMLIVSLSLLASASETPVYGGKTIFLASDFLLTDFSNSVVFVPYRCTV